MNKSQLIIYFLFFFCFIPEAKSQTNFLPNGNFELGTSALCQCPTSYTCSNDAGRVVDGIHSDYILGDLGCVGSVNHTSSLKAHSGSGYVYFYAGGDALNISNINFPTSTNIKLCVWYSGPQVTGPPDQNSSASFLHLV